MLPCVAQIQRVQPPQSGQMVQRFSEADEEKVRNQKGYKGLSKVVCGLEKTPINTTLKAVKINSTKARKTRFAPMRTLILYAL